MQRAFCKRTESRQGQHTFAAQDFCSAAQPVLCFHAAAFLFVHGLQHQNLTNLFLLSVTPQ